MADVAITSITVGSSATRYKTVQASEAIGVGDAVYDTGTSSLHGLADCTDSAMDLVVGLALGGAATNGYFVVVTSGPVVVNATLVVGTTYVLSEAGAIAPASDLLAGDYVVNIGIATGANTLNVDIDVSGVQVP